MVELFQPGGSGGGTSLTVSDGSTTVTSVGEILFTGATVTNGGGGIADVLISASAISITVGTTTVASGTTGRVLYDNAGVLGEMTNTGSGTVNVLQTSPTLITPALGVASATSIGVSGIITTGVNGGTNGSITFSGSTSGSTVLQANVAAGGTLTLPVATGTIISTDQTTGQTIGTTGARLTKLWATDITVTNAIAGSVTGNAGTATALATGRTISITGDLAYTSPSFDGSGNVTAVGTLATVNTNTGSWGTATQVGQFTVNGKGLITAAANVTITPAVGSITGLGTGVATALGVNVGSAGAFVTFNGALGTPSSGTGTNITGIPAANILAGSFGAGAYVISTSLQVATLELGAATDTTISRVSAGVIAVEGATVYTQGGALGTPASGTLTNATGLPAASVVAGTFGTGSYTMDTKLTVPQIINTSNAITASANAATVPITSRISTVTNNSAATLTITITTTSAVDGQEVMVRILDSSAAAQTITWVNTENSTISVPTTSNGSTTLPVTVGFQYNALTSKWRCIGNA